MASSSIDPGSPGRSRSANATRQPTVAVTVAGVPTGTAKAAVLTSTAVEAQRRPPVASDCAPADRPAAPASPADLARDAARAAEWAASLTVVRANQTRPPATMQAEGQQ